MTLKWLAFEKKAISILAGNLNSGRSYLITAVLHSDYTYGREKSWFYLGQYQKLISNQK